MQKFIFLFLTVILCINQGHAQPLSPSAKVSLLICAPGDEIYSYWGHAAIRVQDPLYQMDSVFNYGVFDFFAPHFYWRFAKGETDYQLGIQRMSSFLRVYRDDQQKVTEYELLLTPAERQSIYDALVENYKPENRIYRYSHFEDNCSTRLRDQIEKALSGKIKYDTSRDKRMSFRDLIELYFQDNSWDGLGIKLALGLPTDRIATFSEKMFLPDYLGDDMAKAVVERDGKTTSLTGEAVILFDAPAWKRSFSFTSPVVVILLFFLAVVVLTILERERKTRYHWLDIVVFIAFGIAGMILYFTTFISVMPSTKWNLNLIWAFPIHFLLGILWIFPSMRPKLFWYVRLTAIVTTLFLISMYFLPQTFHWLVVPLCLILIIRVVTISKAKLFQKVKF